MARPNTSSFMRRYILSDDYSWANWLGQIKEQAATYQLLEVLNPIPSESRPLKFPGIPNYPNIINGVDYLTVVPKNNETNDNPPAEPVYEFTVLKRAQFNHDKAINASERELVREKRANYSRLRSFIFETLDDSNKSHLYACINDTESSEFGSLVHILKTHRQQSESASRTGLDLKLQELKKNKSFPVIYEKQLKRLNEWFDLVVRGKLANHQTYTGYTIIQDLLMAMRSYNESMFQMHYDQMLFQEKNKVPADFKAWVDDLREKLSANQSHFCTKDKMSRSTFASLQGVNQEDNKITGSTNLKKGQDKEGPKRKNQNSSYRGGKRFKARQECPCDRGCTTSWSKCYHLTPIAAPPNF
ncbi:hypothetical protein K3495_g14743 [Podosphaera aphanis]|nr:hypothetical protein K3495_g14743 [Podosphaera aphanis]